MELRPYQQECVQIVNNFIDKDEPVSGLIVMATGLGKTATFANFKRAGRTLILSHRDELVHQPEKYYDCTFGVEKAEKHADREEVVSASVQSLCKDSRLHRYSPDDFHTIIIDEAHHAAASSYRKILDYFSGARIVIGVTATPKRGDKVRLDNIFDNIIFVRDLRWGIENGYLSRIRCERVYGDFSLDKIKLTAGDYNQKQLEQKMTDAKVISTAAKAYMEKLKDRHTLIYCVSIKACELLKNTICDLLPEEEQDKIAVLSGKTDLERRKQILEEFSSGKIMCIINCMVLTEGTDLPICDAVMNLRPTRNDSLYQQMVGRGTRVYEGKDYCLVVDVVPDENAPTRNLCTAPTLFGIDPKQLSEKQVNSLTDEYDLLDLCDCLAEVCIDLAKEIELKVEAFNAFVEERENVIKENAEAGFKQIAEKYTSLLKENIDEDVDFDNLYYTTQPDESKYYRITPSFEEEICISKPNILGDSIVNFHLNWPYPIGNSNSFRFAAEMKLEEAILLIRNYCELLPDYCRASWDKDRRKEWESCQMTEKQKAKVLSSFSRYGISRESVDDLNKMEVSSLIDLQKDLQQKKRFIKNHKVTKNTQQKTIEKMQAS